MAISTIIYCLIYVDLLYCLDVTETPPHLVCTSNTIQAYGLYNEIARLLALVFISCMLIFIFDYKTIRNIRKRQANIISIGNCQQGI